MKIQSDGLSPPEIGPIFKLSFEASIKLEGWYMQSDATAKFDWAKKHAVATLSAAILYFDFATGGSTSAQTNDGNAGGSINVGGRAGVAVEAPPRTVSAQDHALAPLEFSASGGFATDYIYRGTTLSDHGPAVGAVFEATAFDLFYLGSTITSVKLPSQPAAEITLNSGVRPKLGNVTFDFGWTRFFYPGESAPPGKFAGIEYWEAAARADTTIAGLLSVVGELAYSPNFSNTGAWSKYAAFGLGIEVPRRLLPGEVSFR
jgi:hypothetical protein